VDEEDEDVVVTERLVVGRFEVDDSELDDLDVVEFG
jgi:hypothetical protein